MFRQMYVAVSTAIGVGLCTAASALPASSVIHVNTYDARDMHSCVAAQGWGWVKESSVLSRPEQRAYDAALWTCVPHTAPRTTTVVAYCWLGGREVAREKCAA